MADITMEDARTLYQGCVVMFKNIPVKIARITDGGIVRFKSLRTLRTHEDEFSLDKFNTPLPRLGFVNCGGSVIFVQRKPVRRYQAGINNSNTSIINIDRAYYPEGLDVIYHAMAEMCFPEFGEMLDNKYPSFEESFRRVKEFGGACAFDKQFCITDNHRIYYRSDYVGDLPRGCTKVEQIVFHPGNECLHNVIGENYEKVVRVPR
jgi:hypothetical protein